MQGQIGEGLEEIKSVMKSVLEGLTVGEAVGGEAGGDGERKKKKRKTSPSPEDGTASPGLITGGERLSLLSRYAKLYVSSSSKLLTNTLPTQLLDSLKEENRSLLIEVVIPLVEFGLGGGVGEREREMVLGAGLRLVGGLRDVLGEEEMDQVVAGTEERLKKLGRMLGESKVGGEVKLEIVSRPALTSSRSILRFGPSMLTAVLVSWLAGRYRRPDFSSTISLSPARPTSITQTCSIRS